MKKILILLLTALFLFACDFDRNHLERIPVTGEVVKDQKSLESFTEIIFAGPFDVVIDQNGSSDVLFETYESLMQWVRTEMLEDGTMLMYLEDTSKSRSFHITFDDEDELDDLSKYAILSGSRLKWPENEKLLNVVLSVDDLDKIQILGESNIKMAQTFRTNELEFDVAGAVHLEGNFDVNELDFDVAGAGNLNLSGRARYLDLDCAGAGTIKAYDLIVEDINLDIAGVCNAQVYATENLDVDMAGMGTVRYKGNPSGISIEKAGIGSVKQAESDKKQETDI